jgi:hypothetical protein
MNNPAKTLLSYPSSTYQGKESRYPDTLVEISTIGLTYKEYLKAKKELVTSGVVEIEIKVEIPLFTIHSEEKVIAA